MYHFEIHKYAPEMNKAFIRGSQIPGYTPKAKEYGDMVRDLRIYLKPRIPRLNITIKHIGGTEGLKDETFTILNTKKAKKLFLQQLNKRSRGRAEFLENGTLKEKDYNYKIIKVQYRG